MLCRSLVGGKWYEFKIDAKKMLFGEYISVMEIMQKITEAADRIEAGEPHGLTDRDVEDVILLLAAVYQEESEPDTGVVIIQ